jgi:hypothetical protein
MNEQEPESLWKRVLHSRVGRLAIGALAGGAAGFAAGEALMLWSHYVIGFHESIPPIAVAAVGSLAVSTEVLISQSRGESPPVY